MKWAEAVEWRGEVSTVKEVVWSCEVKCWVWDTRVRLGIGFDLRYVFRGEARLMVCKRMQIEASLSKRVVRTSIVL